MKISTLVASALVASATAADYIMWNAPSVTLDNADLWGKSIFVLFVTLPVRVVVVVDLLASFWSSACAAVDRALNNNIAAMR